MCWVPLGRLGDGVLGGRDSSTIDSAGGALVAAESRLAATRLHMAGEQRSRDVPPPTPPPFPWRKG